MKELVIFYCDIIYKQKNLYFCNSGLGRFLDEVANRYDMIRLCAPVEINEVQSKQKYRILSRNIQFQELPPFSSFISALLNRSIMLRNIKKFSKEWNSPVYIRWPTPLAYEVFKLCRKRGLPVTLHLVGDTKSIIRESGKYTKVLKFLALMYISFIEIQLIGIMKNSTVLVNGTGLRRLYINKKIKVKEIRSATLTRNELFEGDKVFNTLDVKVLYVGVLKPEKGVQYLIEGLNLLLKKGYTARLTIVGDGPIKENLEDLIDSLNLQNKISLLGYVPIGVDLLKIYGEHDIFVLPSVSEGTPRVLLEAMASKLFVIATDVGGVSFTISNGYNGVLVEPKSAHDICDSIIEAINNHEKRMKIVNNGFEFAKNNTIEDFVKIVETAICENIS